MIGAEWVLYLLLALSVISVTLILERAMFYRQASRGIEEFSKALRSVAAARKWDEAAKLIGARLREQNLSPKDLDSAVAQALVITAKMTGQAKNSSIEILSELAQDAVILTKLKWEKNLSILATIGSNAPFIGLFGTVLGIIRAFHDLSQQVGTGVQGVTSGIAEALVATAVGILVAIPAVVAFNLFQRKVKEALSHAEALKSFLIGQLAE